MCVYVPDQLAGKADVGDVISFYTYLKSIWQPYIRLSVHYPVVTEICKLINQNS